jgi:hypothetical protein
MQFPNSMDNPDLEQILSDNERLILFRKKLVMIREAVE